MADHAPAAGGSDGCVSAERLSATHHGRTRGPGRGGELLVRLVSGPKKCVGIPHPCIPPGCPARPSHLLHMPPPPALPGGRISPPPRQRTSVTTKLRRYPKTH